MPDERVPTGPPLQRRFGRAIVNRGLFPVEEYPYESYREQIRDEDSSSPPLHTWATFALNRVGGALFNPYAEAQVTPWPYQGEHYLPVNSGRYSSQQQVYRMGGLPVGEGLSITNVQRVQSAMRAWPFLKNKMRDILFGGDD